MNLEDTARALKNIPLFENLEPSRLKLLAFASDRLTFDDKEEVCHMGEAADSAYFIEDGQVDITIEQNSNIIKLAELGKGELFGEMGLFLSTGRTATVTAHGPLTVMKIDGDLFLNMVTQNPEAALAVMKSLSQRVADTSARMANNNSDKKN